MDKPCLDLLELAYERRNFRYPAAVRSIIDLLGSQIVGYTTKEPYDHLHLLEVYGHKMDCDIETGVNNGMPVEDQINKLKAMLADPRTRYASH